MGRRSIVIVTSLLLLAACKKDKPAEPAADQPAGSGSAVEKPARPAPPPEAVSSKLGEKTGGS